MKYILVSRHAGAIAWLKKKGYDGKVMPHFSGPVKPGVTYVGVLPILKIHEILEGGGHVIVLNLPNIGRTKRGADLSCDEMDRAGATLCVIKRMQLCEVKKAKNHGTMWYDAMRGVWGVSQKNEQNDIGVKYFIQKSLAKKYLCG